MIILHVDNNSTDRENVRGALIEINSDIDFIEASDGLDVYNAIAKEILFKKINCIFVDIDKPLAEGIALLALIKGNKSLNRIPVYVYSSNQSQSEILHVKRLGGVFIHKNSEYGILVDSMKRILANADC